MHIYVHAGKTIFKHSGQGQGSMGATGKGRRKGGEW